MTSEKDTMSSENGDRIDDWSVLDARITETVATTESEKGEFNLAPMGVVRVRKDSDEVPEAHARLWEGSRTFENVRSTQEVTVNFTRNPVVYVRGALTESNLSEYVDSEGRLIEEERDGWVRCSTEFVEEEREGKVERWRLVVENGRVENERLFTVSRGFNSVIEATVHATRVDFKPELEELIEHHIRIARKCGGENEREAADMIAREVGLELED